MENKEFNELLEGLVASLAEEQKEKVKGCQDVNELIALLGELGVELPDELLDDVGGGLNQSTFLNRPGKTPVFGFGPIKTGGGNVGASHMDLKGSTPLTAVHTDVSAESINKGKTSYV